MASTYVNNLRLEEQATGENSGAWGTKLNAALEQIGQALGIGSETIGNADATITVADGANDDARALYIKIASSTNLTATRTITMGPNTMKRIYIIENATGGAQSIIIKQGSGATVTVANSAVKIIQLDGAGSGAAVIDAFVDLDLTGTTTAAALNVSGNIDVDGTTNLDVLDIDGALTQDGGAVFNEASADVDFRVESDGNTHALFVEGSTGNVGIGESANIDAKLHVTSADSGGTFHSQADEIGLEGSGHSGINILSGSSSEGSIYFGDSEDNNAGRLVYDNSTNSMEFFTAATESMRINSSGDVGIGSTAPNAKLEISESADGAKIRLNRAGVAGWDFSIGNSSTLSGVGAGALEFLPQNAGTANEFAIGTAGSTAALVHLTNSHNYFKNNVGINVTPSANWAGNSVLQMSHGAFTSSSSFGAAVSTNIVATASGWSTKYLADGAASAYLQATSDGSHRFYTAASGSAGASATITERMRIDANGHITAPHQPAFLATKSSEDQNNIPVGSTVTITFDSEIFDQNADFASNTFTAPVTGRYQLNMTLNFGAYPDDSNYLWAGIITSNRIIYLALNPTGSPASSNYENATGSVLADMDANDTAYVFVIQGSGSQQTDILANSFFSGYLAC